VYFIIQGDLAYQHPATPMHIRAIRTDADLCEIDSLWGTEEGTEAGAGWMCWSR